MLWKSLEIPPIKCKISLLLIRFNSCKTAEANEAIYLLFVVIVIRLGFLKVVSSKVGGGGGGGVNMNLP